MLVNDIKGFARCRTLSIFVCLILLFFATSTLATVKGLLPDFYAEPGLNPFRDPVSANVTENIDPFSGTLTLTYTDLVIPGNGGFDIKIQRTYNSNNIYLSRKTDTNVAPNLTQLLPRTATGLGWTLHLGRVLKTGGSTTPSICDTNATNPNDDTLDNAILELPDGRQQILFVNATGFSTTFITKEQWVASCLSGGNGLLVISPEGVKYTMDFVRSGGFTYASTSSVDYAWYPTRIEDHNGNFLTISYSTLSAGKEGLISSITASDGRTVSFGYTGTTATTVLLTSITANGQTWKYQYTPLSGISGGYLFLTSVVRPDGSTWTYTYWDRAAGVAGDNVLQTVTYPYGATVTYDYGYVCFMGTTCSSTNDTFNSLVVASKVNGGRDVTAGTWTYSYAPSATEDVTTVTFPGGSYIYHHFGSKMLFGGATICGQTLWKIGLLKEKQIFNGSTLVQDETYTWQPLFKISNEEYVRPPYDGSDENHPRYSDCLVFAPVLTEKDVTRDGTTYSTMYSNFDANFNPQTVDETGQATRTTNLTYFPRNAGQNIVRLVEDEVLANQPTGKSVFRTFDAKGNVTQITRRGVVDNYTYFATGDVNTRTNARNRVWTYSNYLRGVPQNESHPAAVSISRVVNATGTIASETNGRGKTTSYAYDGLNRVTSITRPLGTAVSVAWTATGRTVTRGIYTQTTTFDGFGRVSNIDTAGVTKDISYNALGYKSFESYYSSTAGDAFATDVLGRVTSITHGDGTVRKFQYASGNVVRVTNERDFVTTYSYRSFGDPDNASGKVLMRVDAPETVVTTFARDILGLPTSIAQGGVTRGYGYNGSNFLVSETNPETGTTVYGRDAVGNMTSRAVGTSATTAITYDDLNRLTFIDFPGQTPDASFTYDGNNNVTGATNGVSSRTYSYDDNDNLISENLTVNGNTFTASYSFNALDYLQSITYPKGQIVSLTPDALGRATTLSPYIPGTISYHPTGIPSDFTYANGRRNDTLLNSRQWISRIRSYDNTAYVSWLDYAYDGLGNVASIGDRVGPTFNRTMSYDGLDRLIVADGNWGEGDIAYDTRDNITSQTLGSFALTYTYDTNNRLTAISGSKPYSFAYDVYGNVSGNGTYTFGYDDASNLRTVSGPTTAAYTYDANNMRVRVQQGSKDTYVFYAKNGDLLGEYDADGRFKEYFYLGGKLIAQHAISPNNTAPSATAGTDQDVGEGTSVVLSGSGSDPDGNPLTFSWQQLAGPAVALSSPNLATTSFTAPRVTLDTTLTFALRVDDGDYGGATSARLNVIVRNTNPDDDGDGLPDSWEMQYFGTLAFGPNDDPDGDGITNRQEFLEGTNPNSRDPAPSIVPSVTAQGDLSSVRLSWTTVLSARSYNIYWSTSSGVTKDTGTKISGIKGPPFAHTGLTNGVPYYYVVTAENASGESAESPEATATPTIAPLMPILQLLLGE